MGSTDFQWQEGAGPLTVYGNGVAFQAFDKQLDVLGDQANETWTISPEGSRAGFRSWDRTPNQKSIGQIDAYGIQTVSVDADDQNNTGGETYIVNDMSTTGVTQVNVNLHQYTTSPDANADHVTVNGPAGDDTVSLYTRKVATGQYGQNGLPTYSQQWTEMQISTMVAAPPSSPAPEQTVTYRVDTACPSRATP